MQWLRRSFITGFFVMVPLIISVAAIIWIFGVIDGIATPVATRMFGRNVPGLGVLLTVGVILAVGVVATNVIGKRLLQQVESWLLLVPVFRTIYAPVKQLVAAFSPENDAGFKKVVLVELEGRGVVLGFLTREFTLDRGAGPEPFAAVYVPTNHLYLGDVLVYERRQLLFPDLSVEEGVRVFLTGGVALPPTLRDARPQSALPKL